MVEYVSYRIYRDNRSETFPVLPIARLAVPRPDFRLTPFRKVFQWLRLRQRRRFLLPHAPQKNLMLHGIPIGIRPDLPVADAKIVGIASGTMGTTFFPTRKPMPFSSR